MSMYIACYDLSSLLTDRCYCCPLSPVAALSLHETSDHQLLDVSDLFEEAIDAAVVLIYGKQESYIVMAETSIMNAGT